LASPPELREVSEQERREDERQIPAVITIGEPPVMPSLAMAPAGAVDPVSHVAASIVQRIQQDRQQISKIAQGLVGVQQEFGNVEEDVLDKVFTMRSMEKFIREHNQTKALSETLTAEIQGLKNQATHLDTQLVQTGKESVEQRQQYEAKMQNLEDIDRKDVIAIDHASQWLNWLKIIEQEVFKLREANLGLRQDQLNSVAYVKRSTGLISAEQLSIAHENTHARRLHGEILKQHNYAATCRDMDYQLQLKFDNSQGKRDQAHAEARAVSANGVNNEERFMRVNEAMRARAAKAKRNSGTIKGEIKAQEKQTQEMQTDGQVKLTKLRQELGALRRQSSALESDLMSREQARQINEREMGDMKAQIDAIKAALLSGRMAQMRANNTNLKSTLSEMQKALSESQAAAARAFAERYTSQQEEATSRADAEQASIRAQEAARSALAKVAAIRKEGHDAEDRAAQATMNAEASLTIDCQSIWDTRHHEIIERLNGECVVVQTDLATARALVASLTSTVHSTRAAADAEEEDQD